MKLLSDQNLSFRLCKSIADIFPGSAQVRQHKMDRAGDRQIWEYAKTNGYVLVTQDSDFSDLAALLGTPPKVLWLRCGNQPTNVIEKLLRDHLGAIVDFESDKDADCLELL
jgi:predicted nuclease of predicted toxin-antitoxin system